MKPFARQVLARVPLAEAVLLVLRWVVDETHLGNLFARHRGRCREQVISFSLLVQLISDALLQYDGSGRQSFERAVEGGRLVASIQAAYGKLRRLPIGLSMAFLEQCTVRLQQLFPVRMLTALPRSLSRFAVIVLDGKAIKHVARRLKLVRGAQAGLSGGRALVAMTLKEGLALLMHAHPDGEANDVAFLSDILPVIRQRISGCRLFLADRAFCGPKLFAWLVGSADYFVVRYAARAIFQADPTRPARHKKDRKGRRYVECWGWLGRPSHPQRCYVRHITLLLPGGDKLILVTNLLEPKEVPAVDLLDLYRLRWSIEQMFQQVTEVFHLKALIGSTPEATIFQFAFCLLLYNIIQVVRAYVAEAQKRPGRTISAEKLFVDVHRHLITWTDLIPLASTVAYLNSFSSPEALRARLRRVLKSSWSDRWIKSPPSKHPPRAAPKKKTRYTHGSVYRILLAYQEKTAKNRSCG